MALVLWLTGLAVFLIPVLGPLFVVLMDVVVGLGAIFLWLVLVVKAMQGEAFQLPLIGKLAGRYAGE
jgi:uncharacterized membrane protein